MKVLINKNIYSTDSKTVFVLEEDLNGVAYEAIEVGDIGDDILFLYYDEYVRSNKEGWLIKPISLPLNIELETGNFIRNGFPKLDEDVNNSYKLFRMNNPGTFKATIYCKHRFKLEFNLSTNNKAKWGIKYYGKRIDLELAENMTFKNRVLVYSISSKNEDKSVGNLSVNIINP